MRFYDRISRKRLKFKKFYYLSLLIRLMTTSDLNDSPKELDTEEDNRRHSVPIKIQMENKVNYFQTKLNFFMV